jgi:hypothetical protein
VLLATCLTTLDGLRAAEYPIGVGFLEEVERIVARIEAEIARSDSHGPGH